MRALDQGLPREDTPLLIMLLAFEVGAHLFDVALRRLRGIGDDAMLPAQLRDPDPARRPRARLVPSCSVCFLGGGGQNLGPASARGAGSWAGARCVCF